MTARLTIGLMLALLAGCTPTRYEGVYHNTIGANELIVCEYQETPNGRYLLFCSNDDSRGVW